MLTRNRMITILLLIAFTGFGAKATQLCYVCTGFDANNKTQFYTEFVSEMQNVDDLPKPIQNQCLANPSTVRTCDSYCVNAVATINVNNVGALDLGTQDDSYVLDNIRAMGMGRVVIRTCLDTLVNSTTVDTKKISSIFDIGQKEACISGQLKISGANVDADFCFCQTDRCNKKQAKQTVAAGDIPAPIVDSSYTATCPAPQANYTSIVPNACTKNCSSNSDCSATKQICCKVGGCDYLCTNPVYYKPFVGGTCSQMDFTAQMLRDFYNNFTKSETYFSEVQPYISPISKQCFNQPITPTKNCQTLAYAFGLLTDFTKSNGQSAKQFEYLQTLLGNATSMTLNASFFSQLGKISAVMRGCVEDTYPTALSSGFPKMGPVSGCLHMNETLLGAGIESYLCVCNTGECNLMPVAPQLSFADTSTTTSPSGLRTTSSTRSPTTSASRKPNDQKDTTTSKKPTTSASRKPHDKRDNAGERLNAIESTVILILPVLISFILYQ